MTIDRKRIPPLLIEKMAAGRLTPDEQGKIDRLLSKDEQQRMIQEIQKSNADILQRFPKEQFVADVGGKIRPKSRNWQLQAIAGLAACFLVVFAWGKMNSQNNDEDILLKGSVPHVTVYRKLASGYERLKTDAVGHKGETLQLRYSAAGYQYGAILSIDGTGKVTQHLPSEKKDAETLNQKGEVALPFAYELDDAPQFERFVFVASHKPFSIQGLEASLHTLFLQGNAQTGNVEGPGESIQYSFVVRK